jgi:hypothetical protein
MMKKLLPILLVALASPIFAQLSVTSTDVPFVIDFTGFEGTGFNVAPVPGQLSTETWEVLGFSDGDLFFGNTDVDGDFAKGITTGNVSSGGVYAFDNGGNIALYTQPTSSDFNPGSFTLKIANNTGAFVSEIDLSYIAYIYNNEGRSNSFNVSYSYNNVIFFDVPELDLTSVEADEDSLYTYNQSAVIPGLVLEDGDFFYIKWEGADVSGSGSRDEFGLDDISVTATSGAIIPVVGFSETEIVTGEADGPVAVAVEITSPVTCTAVISVIDSLGTATYGSDFIVSTPFFVDFNEVFDSVLLFNVLIANDAVLEIDETIVLKIDSVIGTCLLGPADELVITIIDNESALNGPCENLYFSEYIEGGSNNKALEIYNPTDAAIDLDGYIVKVFNNGGTAPSNTLNLSGTIAAGGTYNIVNPSADSVLIALADTTSNVTFFNGNDAVVLLQFADTIDVIGRVGEDPITEWLVDTAGTADNTLVRKAAVNKGQTDWTIGATEWNVYGQNEFGFFGSHTADGCAVAGCGTPAAVNVTGAVSFGIKLQWSPVAGAVNYQIQYRALGSDVWLSKNASTNKTKIGGLTGGVTYEYRVRANCGGGDLGAFTDIQTVTTPLKLGQFEDTEDISLYPNPSNGTLYLDGFDTEEDAVVFQLFDMTGRMVMNQTSMNYGNVVEISLPEVQPGTYLVRATKGEVVYQTVVVVE